jgi:hypothetical protein
MPYVSDKEYHEFLKGKRVALVGPAKSVEGTRQGQFIDSHDVVVRVKSIHIPPDFQDDIGTKVDILYTDDESTNDVLPGDSVEKSGDKWTIYENSDLRDNNIDLKYICSVYPQGEWFFDRFIQALNGFSQKHKTRIINNEPYFSVKAETNRPNAGFSAIIDLLTAPLAELYITGIDFYRSLYRNDYLNSGYTPNTIRKWSKTNDGIDPKTGREDRHDPDAQFKYFKYKMYLRDNRIKVDKFMEKVLANPIYENFDNNYE